MTVLARGRPSALAEFERDGFAIIASVISEADCDELLAELQSAEPTGAGSRTLLQREAVAAIAGRIRHHPEISELLAQHAQAVQCTLFAKGPDSRWSVTPHQDLSIPVREQRQLAGWRGWSQKEGMTFVHAPDAVLEQLVAVRLQLDEPSAENGPLEVVPGTHRLGRLSNDDILRRAAGGRHRCMVPRGGVLVMRPLLIHASARPTDAQHRRVLQFLFGPPLPEGMQWAINSTSPLSSPPPAAR